MLRWLRKLLGIHSPSKEWVFIDNKHIRKYHTGLIGRIEDNKIYVIEGNTSGESVAPPY